MPQTVETAAPTRARHVTLLFVVLLALITYMDRVAISVAAADIRRDLGLSLVQMGWALSVFGWAYALFEIPGGWLGDRIGPRRVLMRIVLWWSFFTAFTGWVWSGTLPDRHARAVRRRRGRSLPQPHPDPDHLAARRRTRACPGAWCGWPRA